MARTKRAASILVIALAAVFSLSHAEAASNAKRVRLAYAGWGVGTAVAYVGIDGGIFKKHEIEVDEIFIQDAVSGGVQALMGVDFLLGFGNPLAIFSPVLGGADIVGLASHASVEKYGMGVAKDVASVKDLKGKKVGVSALGGRSDLIARVILRRAGLDPQKDVEIVAAGLSPNRAAAISKNLIQGTPLSPEVAAEAKSLGIKILEVKSVPLTTALLMTTRSFIKKDEGLVRRFVTGYATAIHFFLTRRAESLTIIKKYFKGTGNDALENMYQAFTTQLEPLPFGDKEAIQAVIDAVAVADQRAQKLKPGDFLEPKFLEELKAGGFVEKLYAEKVSL
jgi:NitT/TauT family transport system substrate-binding protein